MICAKFLQGLCVGCHGYWKKGMLSENGFMRTDCHLKPCMNRHTYRRKEGGRKRFPWRTSKVLVYPQCNLRTLPTSLLWLRKNAHVRHGSLHALRIQVVIFMMMKVRRPADLKPRCIRIVQPCSLFHTTLRILNMRHPSGTESS